MIDNFYAPPYQPAMKIWEFQPIRIRFAIDDGWTCPNCERPSYDRVVRARETPMICHKCYLALGGMDTY